MLFNVEDLPDHIRPYKVLSWAKIKNIKSKNYSTPDVEKIKNIGWRLVKTCLLENGVGLAAAQCGVFKNIMICMQMTEIQDPKGYVYAPTNLYKLYINPTYEVMSFSKKSKELEGCLSVPEEQFLIDRYNSIKVTNQIPKHSSFAEETFMLENFQARLFLHEFDHTLGISIPQRWEIQEKKSVYNKINNK